MFDFTNDNLFIRAEIAEQLLGSKAYDYIEELNMSGDELDDYIEKLNSQLES